MKKYEYKEVVKEEKVLKEIICDECERSMSETEHDFYYEVTTSHGLWGNDSIESFEYLDFCSWQCLTNNQGKYFADARYSCRYEIELVEK